MWKKNFKKLMFPIDPKKLDIEGAIELKYKHIPKSLFKYRPFDSNNHSLTILKNDLLNLSSPNEFNDPFDCSLTVSAPKLGNASFIKNMDRIIDKADSESKFTKEEKENLRESKNFIHDFSKLYAKKYPIKKVTGEYVRPDEFAEINTEIINKMLKESYNDIRSSIKDTRITCFSEDNKSILMWSHYSDNHKGLCIEYNFKELSNHDLGTRLLCPVFYQDELFDASEYIKNSIVNDTREIDEPIIVSHMADHFNMMMYELAALVKSKEWSYEKEWRFVSGFGVDLKFLRSPKPKAVYLGSKVFKEHKNEVLKIAKKRNFNVYQMQMDESKFALNPKKLL